MEGERMVRREALVPALTTLLWMFGRRMQRGGEVKMGEMDMC